jgi:S-adenosylmethionine:tRNA ribosyltransferase-isomerase
VLVSEFDFPLPEELIAQEAAPRGQSRMLVLDRASGALNDARVDGLPSFLQAGDVLVVNNTRVFAARLLGHRVPSGGAVECLLLRKIADAPSGGETWEALMHPGQKLKVGAVVRFENESERIDGEVLDRHFFGRRTIRLMPAGGARLDTLIDHLGHMPLPPYIKRADTLADRDRYQTVFAERRGSVAAPTAGLHFTPAILDAARHAGVHCVDITLHVGYGTFKPIRSERVEGHVVDPEHYEIGDAAAATIERARQEGRRIIAVGTTTTRALEHAARDDGRIHPRAGDATTFIYPGFDFRVINGLITNFHLPKSSLLMLVCAFAGRERVLSAYRHAIEQQYRFYSYGDAMLIL